MTILGKDPQGENVWLYPEERLTGCYVIGANGTGKSTLLLNVIIQDIEQNFGVGLLDPHGDLTNAVIAHIPERRRDQVILLNPLDVDYPFGLNLFECANPNDILSVEHAVNSIIGVYEKVFNMSVAETPRLSQYIRQVAYALVGSGYTMNEIPLLLLDKAFRDKVLKDVASTNTRLFWKSYDALRPTEQLDRSESTLDRIDSLLSNSIIRNIVGQTRTTIDFRAIMDKGKILLVSLSARYESLTSLLGSIIIGQLLTAALSRASTNKRRQFNLYADEYQRFATPDFSVLLTEARKFGVATTIAHQVRSQLDEKNAATALQAGSLVCFRLTSEDAEELAPEFLLTPKEAVKPQQTIPRNCNEYLSRHPNAEVRAFYGDFLLKVERNSHIKEREEKFWDIGMQEEYFVADEVQDDFGEGVVSYDPKSLMEIYTLIENLFYEVMTREKIDNMSLDFMDEIDEILLVVAALRRFGRYLLRLNRMDNPFEFPKEIAHNTQKSEAWFKEMQEEQIRKYKFELLLDRIMTILRNEKINATSTEYIAPISQQTYSDYKNYLANQLVHLKRGQAMVKLPKGEHLIETIPNTTGFNDTPSKSQIIDMTRKTYCRNRHEVEEEIRHRHQVTSPTTTRRGTVE